MNLNEDNLDAGVLVMWRNKEYTTGNRYHEMVELYQDGKFVRTVSMKHISLIKSQ